MPLFDCDSRNPDLELTMQLSLLVLGEVRVNESRDRLETVDDLVARVVDWIGVSTVETLIQECQSSCSEFLCCIHVVDKLACVC